MFEFRKGHARLLLWAIVPAFLFLHGIVATSLPDRLSPLSTFCIVLIEVAAIAACFRASRNVDYPVRAFWLLVACSMLFSATSASLDIFTEIAHTPVLNHVPRLQIFFSMLYEVPLLVAVSIESDRRILGIPRAIHALLSISIGVVLYLEIFDLLTARGSHNPADALLVIRLFDGMDLYLAVAATIRWLGTSQFQERRFYWILSIFLWMNTILPAIHNRILIRHDYIFLDLLVSAPYAFLLVLVLTVQQRSTRTPMPALVRAVRVGSPIFLAAALTLVGMFESRTHFYIGLAATLLAILAYGTLNIFVQSRGLEAEASLLALKSALEKLVDVDGLTGIANRRAFDRTLEREFAAARRTKQPLSLLMIDVDYFKELNDTKGHLAGDEYLVRIAGALRMAVPRVTDLVARYGGEEFSAILPLTDSAGAAKVAETLRLSISNLGLSHPVMPAGSVTISIGFSTFDGSAESSPVALAEAADRALYEAKCRGRNCSVYLSMEDAGV